MFIHLKISLLFILFLLINKAHSYLNNCTKICSKNCIIPTSNNQINVCEKCKLCLSTNLKTNTNFIWPLPQNFYSDLYNRSLSKNGIIFQIIEPKFFNCDILKEVVTKYKKKWFFLYKDNNVKKNLLVVNIYINKKCPGKTEFPQQNMNESYFLYIPSKGDAFIQAEEIWGIVRAFETLSQLIFFYEKKYYIQTAIINDWPEYSVRGVLIDSSRHYLHKNIILRQIDLLAQNKMNLLHWHIVDVQSFPYQSLLFPNLTKGAFLPTHIYTQETIKEILEYGRLQGIRIMPEFDTPGHMTSWYNQPDLLSECKNLLNKKIMPALIDPTNENNYVFLQKFFSEVLKTFPENFLHLGGDEVSFWIENCWVNNKKIQNFMKTHNLKNIQILLKYYTSRLLEILEQTSDKEKKFLFWDEFFHLNITNRNSIVHIWTTPTTVSRQKYIKEIINKGYPVIVSSCWYLNYINYGPDWREGNDQHAYYYCNPRDFNGTLEEKKLVLGGIATMWGEYVDGTNIESRLWPRASAVAERLWSSPEKTKNALEAWPRLRYHRCRLIARGYRAEPIQESSDFCLTELES